MTPKQLCSLAAVAAILCGIAVNSARSEQIIFTLDAPSSIDWSGFAESGLGGGTVVPQTPGSLSAPVSGHFLVDFDPSTSAPPTLDFIGGHGFYHAESNYLATPGVPSSPGTPALANIAAKTSTNFVFFAIRDLNWDFYTPTTLTRAGGVYAGNQTKYTVLSGATDTNVSGRDDATGDSNFMTGGNWSLSQTSSSTWSLTGDIAYTYGVAGQYQLTATARVHASAQFSAADNIVTNVPSQVGATEPVVIQANGAATNQPGGVTLSLPPLPEGSSGTGVTDVVVQEIPNLSGISQAALEAAHDIPVFAAVLEGQTLSEAPNLQIWNVHPTGFVVGTSATLVFSYDPAMFPDIDQSKLGIWHFNTISGHWDFGGTVNVGDHTITYVTNSFSEFIAGVPEPSTWVMAATSLVGLLAFARPKR